MNQPTQQSQRKDTAFTGSKEPPPDRFRTRDIWRGPDGCLYRVGERSYRPTGVRIMLIPIGSGVPVGVSPAKGFRRQSWGGMP